jgi:NAD(P)-dependent dehydrogenase (short-subunit alcohol dehydrogenase family)
MAANIASDTPTIDRGSAADVAWIAGVGASAGLGAAIARRFARAGLTIAVTGRNADRLQAVASEIGAAGGWAHALPGDVSMAADVTRLSAAVAALGRLRAAVFNAGNSVRGNPLEITPEQFESTWRGSAFAGFLFARSALPGLLAAGGGTLLFTGATASLRGRGPFVAFASAKAALRSVAQSVAREYGPQGVHSAHVIIDGGIDGERLRSSSPQRAAQAGADGLLSPDAIAETYWQLHCQDRSAWTHELDLRPFAEPF